MQTKWKQCRRAKLCPTLFDPTNHGPPGSSVHGIFQATIYWDGLPFPSPGDLPNPGNKPTSPALAGGFFTTEPPDVVTVIADSVDPDKNYS